MVLVCFKSSCLVSCSTGILTGLSGRLVCLLEADRSVLLPRPLLPSWPCAAAPRGRAAAAPAPAPAPHLPHTCRGRAAAAAPSRCYPSCAAADIPLPLPHPGRAAAAAPSRLCCRRRCQRCVCVCVSVRALRSRSTWDIVEPPSFTSQVSPPTLAWLLRISLVHVRPRAVLNLSMQLPHQS